MSVWKSACYKDDAFQFFARNTPPNREDFARLAHFLDFHSDLDGPLNEHITLTPGNVKAQVDPKDVVHFSSYVGVSKSASFNALVSDVSNFRYGLHAVYTFISSVYGRAFTHKLAKEENPQMERDIFMVGLVGGNHTQRDIMDKAPIMLKAREDYVVPIQFINKALRAVAAAHRSQRHMQEVRFANVAGNKLPEVDTKLKALFPSHTFYTHRGVVLMISKGTPWSLVLLQKDLDRIEKFLHGAASARVYAQLYGVLDQSKRNQFVNAVEAWQDCAVRIMGKCTKEEANTLCRTFDVGYFVTLARFSADVDDGPLALQINKYVTETLSHHLPLAVLESIGGGLPFKEKLEVYQQYKLFPAPDYDSYSTIQRQEAMYIKYAKKYDGVENKAHYPGIMLYHRWMMLCAYHKRHGRCPGQVVEGVTEKDWHKTYPLVSPDMVPYAEMDDVNFNGDFVYNHRDDDCLDLIKDKAICPTNIKHVRNAYDLGQMPVSQKSQLVEVLKRLELPDLNILRKEVSFFDVKADDKAEAKKAGGRLFFEAHSDVRLVLSEYEDSNADYARNMVGSVLGRNTVDVKKIINSASKYGHPDAPKVPVYISFDLEKFSPAFNLAVSKQLDAHWAEAYGVPEIAQASKILTEGSIHYVKGNFHHEIKKHGSDFEGFFGRRNTMYHCAVMGYAVNRLKHAGILEGQSYFASLIDDGLLRVMLPKEGLRDHVKELKRTLELIYSHGSLTISWDKTFVSSRVCVFLNEVRVFGRSFTPGMKAILRIANRSDDICPSLLSDLALVASTTRGAVTAGALPTGAYAMYALSVGDAIRRWSKGKIKTDIVHVLRMYLPARMGGLGLVGLLSLAGSLVHDDMVEALGVMQAFGTRFPIMRDAINKLVNVNLTTQDELAKFANPSKMKSRDTTIKADRGYQKIKHYLMFNAHLPAIEKYQNFLKGEMSDRDSMIPQAPAKLAVEIRERIWKASPYHVIEAVASKFLKSTSALVFVPRRVLYKAMIANKTEAASYFKTGGFVETE